MNRSLGFYLIKTGKSWSLRRSVPTCTWQHWTCDPLKILCSNENSHFPHDQLLCVCRKHKNTGFHFVVLTIDWLNILPQPCTHKYTHSWVHLSFTLVLEALRLDKWNVNVVYFIIRCACVQYGVSLFSIIQIYVISVILSFNTVWWCFFPRHLSKNS